MLTGSTLYTNFASSSDVGGTMTTDSVTPNYTCGSFHLFGGTPNTNLTFSTGLALPPIYKMKVVGFLMLVDSWNSLEEFSVRISDLVFFKLPANSILAS